MSGSKVQVFNSLLCDTYTNSSGGGLVTKLCPTLTTPWTLACRAPLSMEFSRQEYWSGLPFPSPGDLPDPGIKPRSPVLQADSLPTELGRKPGTSGCVIKLATNSVQCLIKYGDPLFYITNETNHSYTFWIMEEKHFLYLYTRENSFSQMDLRWIFIFRLPFCLWPLLWTPHSYAKGYRLPCIPVLGHGIDYLLYVCILSCVQLFATLDKSPRLLILLRWEVGSLPPAPPGKPHYLVYLCC